jgi:hypothetical protein
MRSLITLHACETQNSHRVAISNHRLAAFDREQVSLHWKDYAHGAAQKVMTLATTEFLRRFFLHVLTKGFVRIRHFGSYSVIGTARCKLA